MGFFSKYNDTEQSLLNYYIEFFTNTGIPSPSVTAGQLLDRAIEESKKYGTYYLPHNFGDIILGESKAKEDRFEKAAQIFRRKLDYKKQEGVRNDDIKKWWNLYDVERKMQEQVDLFYQTALLISLNERGLSEGERVLELQKAYPIYGEATLAQNIPEGDDKPLPFELKDRVNIFLEKYVGNSEKLKSELNNFSSLNAFIRDKVKQGEI
ncbi:MAG: hypothetical protein HY764_00650 [Candidatus Portnoybacteria bacterium]|nr:hypothetical protein [Candidatus Portnoybacteria bacterium]